MSISSSPTAGRDGIYRGKTAKPKFPYPTLLHDNVLVRMEKPERMTVTKMLWIPETAQRADYEVYQATVLACGPGRRNAKTFTLVPIEVKPGDRVLFYWFGGEDCTLVNSPVTERWMVIHEGMIQGVIEP